MASAVEGQKDGMFFVGHRAVRRLVRPRAQRALVPDLEFELELVSHLTAAGRKLEADPTRAGVLISAMGATPARRHVEALVELEERLAKLSVADPVKVEPLDKRPSAEDIARSLDSIRELQVALAASMAANEVRDLVHQELGRFGEQAGFSPPPENWSLWRDWVRENATKLEPAVGSGAGR